MATIMITTATIPIWQNLRRVSLEIKLASVYMM
jgi:hypothetical protein